MKTQEIRDKWIEYFTKKCPSAHKHIASASLVPDNPTLLLNAAGMVQFVPIFMGTKPPPEPPRAVTIQKCARVGGKDSDLENIGRTTRHHSFFEMLGNFSFGDYFKAEAIPWAWEFVTKELGLDAQKLYVSVFEGDEQNAFDQEAYDYWWKLLADIFPDEEERKCRIMKMGRKDNFWGPPGATGPCGPCSEIYYDTRHCEESRSDDAAIPPNETEDFDDRYVEIWNLVFMEFNKDEEGKFAPLENKNIDTGAGLERLATILQGVNNTFETNELRNIIDTVAEFTGKKYGQSPETDVYLKIVTDHVRCLSFLIADGVRPSNVGRGYVLRMILRRAARFLFLLKGDSKPYLYELTKTVVENYKTAYPELETNAKAIADACLKEEEAFAKTISNGMSIIEEKFASLESPSLQGEQGSTKQTSSDLPGDFVFDLYATYGFPLELTQDIAEEKGFTIDLEGYEKAKEAHSKASGTGAFDKSVASNAFVADLLAKHGKTEFLGYAEASAKAKVLYKEADRIVFDRTPFYAESGGQLADHGLINGKFKIKNVKAVEGISIHTLDGEAEVEVGDEVNLAIDEKRREFTLKHHTSCHLLQAALRQVLGDGIQQMGSQVGPEYTRFDFNLDRGVKKDELQKVEDIINSWISKKLPAEVKVMQFDDAIKAGALSFFEDKYDDEVRVLFVGEGDDMPSIELCGGTHVSNLFDIGKVVIASESSVASGIRRIKLLAHDVADEFIKEREEKIRLEKEEAEKQALIKEEAKQKREEATKQVMESLTALVQKAETIDEVNVLIADISTVFDFDVDAEVMKTLAEAILANLGERGFLCLANQVDGKVSFLAAASQTLVADKKSAEFQRFNASNAVKAAAQICGGGGGGRPNMAQAGAKDASKIPEALETVKTSIFKQPA